MKNYLRALPSWTIAVARIINRMLLATTGVSIFNRSETVAALCIISIAGLTEFINISEGVPPPMKPGETK